MTNKLRIESYTQAHNVKSESVLGYVSVVIEEKRRIVFTLCRSKSGNIFLSFPTAFINGSWVDTYSPLDKEIGKKMKEEVLKLAAPLLPKNAAAQQVNRPASVVNYGREKEEEYDDQQEDDLPF